MLARREKESERSKRRGRLPFSIFSARRVLAFFPAIGPPRRNKWGEAHDTRQGPCRFEVIKHFAVRLTSNPRAPLIVLLAFARVKIPWLAFLTVCNRQDMLYVWKCRCAMYLRYRFRESFRLSHRMISRHWLRVDNENIWVIQSKTGYYFNIRDKQKHVFLKSNRNKQYPICDDNRCKFLRYNSIIINLNLQLHYI